MTGAVAVAALLLAGCNGATLGLSPRATSIPTPAEVQAHHTRITATGLTAEQLLRAGYAHVDRQCATFFIELQAARHQGAFAAESLTAVTAAAGSILAAASAGTVAIGVTTATLGAGSAILASYRRSALLDDYPDELQQLVVNAQASFEAAQQRRTPATGLTVEEADRLVAAYASFCTLPRMHALAREALATARTQEKPAGGTTGDTPGGGTGQTGGAPAGAPTAAPAPRAPATQSTPAPAGLVPLIGVVR